MFLLGGGRPPSVESPEYSLSSSSLSPEDSLSSDELSSFESHSVYDTFFPFLSDHCASKIVVSSMQYRQLGTYLFASFSNHYYLPFSNCDLLRLTTAFFSPPSGAFAIEEYQTCTVWIFYWLHCTCHKVADQSKYRPATWNGGVNTLGRTLVTL